MLRQWLQRQLTGEAVLLGPGLSVLGQGIDFIDHGFGDLVLTPGWRNCIQRLLNG